MTNKLLHLQGMASLMWGQPLDDDDDGDDDDDDGDDDSNNVQCHSACVSQTYHKHFCHQHLVLSADDKNVCHKSEKHKILFIFLIPMCWWLNKPISLKNMKFPLCVCSKILNTPDLPSSNLVSILSLFISPKFQFNHGCVVINVSLFHSHNPHPVWVTLWWQFWKWVWRGGQQFWKYCNSYLQSFFWIIWGFLHLLNLHCVRF